MEEFINHCFDYRPNLTYLAIGCAYSNVGGFQQHPPFLEKLIQTYNDFNCQIILVDPFLENPPEISNHFGLIKVNDEFYSRDNLDVFIIREKMDFDSMINTYVDDSISKKFILSLINRTILSKQENPENTYLFFAHDFSATYSDSIRTSIDVIYQKMDHLTYYLFQRNIMIDLNYREDPSCFPNLNSEYYGPRLINNSHGSLEIFNPFSLDDEEIATILMHEYQDGIFKKLILLAVKYNFREYSSSFLPVYRQMRIILDRKTSNGINLIRNYRVQKYLLQGVDHNIILSNLDKIEEDKRISIIKSITKNLFNKLESITGFLDFFNPTLRQEIFDEFYDTCNKIHLDDYYILLPILLECQKQLEVFLKDVNTEPYLDEINKYCSKYISDNNKNPLFLELFN